MLIGLDFDNTIVCYDGLFHRLAQERVSLPADLPQTKGQVRDYLRSIGHEETWIELQGIGYGPRLAEASPYPGVKDFLAQCLNRGIRCAIVSHKTLHPFIGPKYDLHEAALSWLKTHGFYETPVTGLSTEAVHLELTKQAKLERIGALGCDFFVDDLPEFLGEAAFPTKPSRILFDPARSCPDAGHYRRADSWNQIASIILGAEGRN